MKRFKSILAAGLITVGFVGAASADDFSPRHSHFTATGSLTVTAAAVSLPCTATMEGVTNGDTALIRSVAFGGLSCAALTPSNLPWEITISNPHNIVLHGVEVSAAVLGICGPGNLQSADSATGKLTISGAGLPGLVPCSVSATFTTKPKLVVEKK